MPRSASAKLMERPDAAVALRKSGRLSYNSTCAGRDARSRMASSAPVGPAPTMRITSHHARNACARASTAAKHIAE